MGGFCSTLQYRHVVDPATYTVNEVDKRIQKKQGQKTAEQLAMQNGRFADEPERQRERLEKRLGPQDEGKWVGRAGARSHARARVRVPRRRAAAR
jgi:hypothetical protein